VLCVNDVRIGFLGYSERRAGAFDRRADILGLMACDQVRMLLNQCDHVIVLVRAGLPDAGLPLPEWRARYRRFIDAGASVVADTGAAQGWETYRNGLVFYGLGEPESEYSLALLLTLRQNGAFTFETRMLETVAGELRFSENEAFKRKIDNANGYYSDDATYLRAVNEMCLNDYAMRGEAKKRGILRTILPGAGDSARLAEEEKLLLLLGDESRRWMTLRALTRKDKT
jgi:hypothetical protein